MRLIDADKLKQLREDVISGKVDIQTEGDLIDACPTVNPYEWISVEDRLPEKALDDEGIPLDFIVWGKGYTHAVAAYFNGVNFYFECFDGSEGTMSDITHWRPLPSPPTGKEN